MALALSMCLSLAKWLDSADNCYWEYLTLHSGEVVLKSLWALSLKVLGTSCWLEKTKEYQESTPHKRNNFVILSLNAVSIFSHTSQKEYYWEGSGGKQ